MLILKSEMKNLILFPVNNDKYILNKIRSILSKENNIVETYKEIGFIKRIFRRIHLKYIRVYSKIWYGSWIEEKQEYKQIIVFDSILDIGIIKDIQNKFPNSKIIFWFWNSISNSKQIKHVEYLKEENIEIWSFDIKDCKKYHLKYNSQFYFNIDEVELEKKNILIRRDVYFIGYDKGRIKLLKRIGEIFSQQKISFLFEVVKDRRKKYLKNEMKYLIKKVKKYEEVLVEIEKSKVVLEINSGNQSGLTLRAMESLFYNKKLISNNKNLREYDFYNSDNIFIFNKIEEEIEEIIKFLKKPYNVEVNKYKENYSIQKWLERFNIND